MTAETADQKKDAPAEPVAQSAPKQERAKRRSAKPTVEPGKDETLVYNPSLDKWSIVPDAIVKTLEDSGYTKA